MVSYVVTGVSRGIGYAFLDLLSKESSNVVVGIVRNKAATKEKIAADPAIKDRSNIHIVEADLTKYTDIKRAASEADAILGGSLDYLIGNAGLIPLFDAYDPIGVLGEKPEELEQVMIETYKVNVIANVHLINLFMPLIMKGQTKKVIIISSGFADVDWTAKYDLTPGSLYSASKAAMNMVVAKFSAQYRKDGVLFLNLAPGMVDNGLYKDSTPEEVEKLQQTMAKFSSYQPDFSGPLTPQQSTSMMKGVWEKASIENGNAGDFLSQHGNRVWL
jgi:NAD(P)-dependent dehydrogenase (short-subunit alcohol dehydrogenase family)